MDGPSSTLQEDTQVQPVQQTQSQPQSLPSPPIQTQTQTTTQTQPQPSAQLQPQTQPQPQLSPQQPQLQSQPQAQPQAQPQHQPQQPQYQVPQQAAVIQQTQGAKPGESTPFVYAAYAKLSNNPAVPVKPQTPQTFTSPLNTATSVSATQSTRPTGLDPTQMLVQNLIVFMSKMQEQQEEKLKAFQAEVEKRLTAQEAMLRDLLAASKAIKDSQQQNTVQLLQKLNALQAGKARDESAGGMYPQPPTLGLAAQPASPQTAPSKPKDSSFDLSKQYARTPSTSGGVQQPAVQAAAAYAKPMGQVAGVQMSQSQFQPQMQQQVQPQLQPQFQPQFQPQQQLQPQMQPQPLYPMAAEYRQTPSYPSSLPYAAPASSAYAAPQTSYDSDFELAKKLQADFDTEAKRSSAASSKGGAATGGSTATKENKESCPVCGLKVETSQLNSHVNGHFDDDEQPAKASSAVTPGGPEENSSIWSRLFGGGGGKPKAEEKSEKESKPAAAPPSAAVPPNVQPQAVPYALPGGAIPYYYAPAQANFLPGVQTGAGPYRPGVPVNPVYYSAEPVLYSPPPPH